MTTLFRRSVEHLPDRLDERLHVERLTQIAFEARRHDRLAILVIADAVTAMTGIVSVAGSSRICRNAVMPLMPGSWICPSR